MRGILVICLKDANKTKIVYKANLNFNPTNSESKSSYSRVKAAQLLNTNVHYDSKKYLELLPSSAANILNPFGYTTNNLYDLIVHGEEQKPLQ